MDGGEKSAMPALASYNTEQQILRMDGSRQESAMPALASYNRADRTDRSSGTTGEIQDATSGHTSDTRAPDLTNEDTPLREGENLTSLRERYETARPDSRIARQTGEISERYANGELTEGEATQQIEQIIREVQGQQDPGDRLSGARALEDNAPAFLRGRDADRDGLTDIEEMATGDNPLEHMFRADTEQYLQLTGHTEEASQISQPPITTLPQKGETTDLGDGVITTHLGSTDLGLVVGTGDNERVVYNRDRLELAQFGDEQMLSRPSDGTEPIILAYRRSDGPSGILEPWNYAALRSDPDGEFALRGNPRNSYSLITDRQQLSSEEQAAYDRFTRQHQVAHGNTIISVGGISSFAYIDRNAEIAGTTGQRTEDLIGQIPRMEQDRLQMLQQDATLLQQESARLSHRAIESAMRLSVLEQSGLIEIDRSTDRISAQLAPTDNPEIHALQEQIRWFLDSPVGDVATLNRIDAELQVLNTAREENADRGLALWQQTGLLMEEAMSRADPQNFAFSLRDLTQTVSGTQRGMDWFNALDRSAGFQNAPGQPEFLDTLAAQLFARRDEAMTTEDGPQAYADIALMRALADNSRVDVFRQRGPADIFAETLAGEVSPEDRQRLEQALQADTPQELQAQVGAWTTDNPDITYASRRMMEGLGRATRGIEGFGRAFQNTFGRAFQKTMEGLGVRRTIEGTGRVTPLPFLQRLHLGEAGVTSLLAAYKWGDSLFNAMGSDSELRDWVQLAGNSASLAGQCIHLYNLMRNIKTPTSLPGTLGLAGTSVGVGLNIYDALSAETAEQRDVSSKKALLDALATVFYTASGKGVGTMVTLPAGILCSILSALQEADQNVVRGEEGRNQVYQMLRESQINGVETGDLDPAVKTLLRRYGVEPPSLIE
jgi:hypothetical protein